MPETTEQFESTPSEIGLHNLFYLRLHVIILALSTLVYIPYFILVFNANEYQIVLSPLIPDSGGLPAIILTMCLIKLKSTEPIKFLNSMAVFLCLSITFYGVINYYGSLSSPEKDCLLCTSYRIGHIFMISFGIFELLNLFTIIHFNKINSRILLIVDYFSYTVGFCAIVLAYYKTSGYFEHITTDLAPLLGGFAIALGLTKLNYKYAKDYVDSSINKMMKQQNKATQ